MIEMWLAYIRKAPQFSSYLKPLTHRRTTPNVNLRVLANRTWVKFVPISMCSSPIVVNVCVRFNLSGSLDFFKHIEKMSANKSVLGSNSVTGMNRVVFLGWIIFLTGVWSFTSLVFIVHLDKQISRLIHSADRC